MSLIWNGVVPATTEGRYALAKTFYDRGLTRAREAGAREGLCLLEPAEQDIVAAVEREWLAVWQFENAEHLKARVIH